MYHRGRLVWRCRFRYCCLDRSNLLTTDTITAAVIVFIIIMVANVSSGHITTVGTITGTTATSTVATTMLESVWILKPNNNNDNGDDDDDDDMDYGSSSGPTSSSDRHDSAAVKTFVEHILSNSNVIFTMTTSSSADSSSESSASASSYEHQTYDISSSASSPSSVSNESTNQPATTLYHIIIANSTTSMPSMIVVSSASFHHHLQQAAAAAAAEAADGNVSSISSDFVTIGANIPNNFTTGSASDDKMIIMQSPIDTEDPEAILSSLPPGLFNKLVQTIYSGGGGGFGEMTEMESTTTTTTTTSTTTTATIGDGGGSSENPWYYRQSSPRDPFHEPYEPNSLLESHEQEVKKKPLPGNGRRTVRANHHNYVRNILVMLAYGAIMVVSLGGNYLVCHVIYSTPKLRTTTNILIFSLTVSDIITTILNIPFNCARFLLSDYPFPDAFCVLMPAVQVASVYVSTLTMAAICLHRYRSILGNGTTNLVIASRSGFNHGACSMTRMRIKLWILFIWLLSVVFALPHSMFNHVMVIESVHPITGAAILVRRCRAEYPKSVEKQMPLFLSLLVTVTQFLIPLGITCILYMRIGRIISHQGAFARHHCDELNRRLVEAKRKRITMLVLIVVGFLVTWLPLTVYHLLVDFHLVHFRWNLFLVLHIWAMTSVCYNPFIYCFMNEDFRKRSRQILASRTTPLFCCWCCFVITGTVIRPGSGSTSTTTQTARGRTARNENIVRGSGSGNSGSGNGGNHHRRPSSSLNPKIVPQSGPQSTISRSSGSISFQPALGMLIGGGGGGGSGGHPLQSSSFTESLEPDVGDLDGAKTVEILNLDVINPNNSNNNHNHQPGEPSSVCGADIRIDITPPVMQSPSPPIDKTK